MANRRRWRVVVRRVWREWVLPIGVVVAGLLTFRSAVADWNDVPTGSMKPTILEGDRIFVNKLAYDLKVPFTTLHVAEWGEPQRGEIVVLYKPTDGTRLVKRVVGVPGDEIELRDGRLIINGQAAEYGPLEARFVEELDEGERAQHQYATEQIDKVAHPVMSTPRAAAIRSFEALTIPEGKYYVMGDNRDNSGDSRNFGLVDRSAIVGRASRVVLSFDRSRWFLPRWERFFRRLP